MSTQPQVTNTYTQYNAMSASTLNPEQEDLVVLNRLTDLFTQSSNHRMKQESRWKETYEFYYGLDVEMKKKAAHQSKIFIPRPKMIIDSMVPRVVMNILAKDPIWTVNPTGADDTVQARVWSKVLSYQTRQQPNIYRNMTTAFKDAMMYGIGWIKTGWDYCETTVQRRVSSTPVVDIFTGELRPPEIIQQRMVLADNPTIQVCDIGEIYYDPAAESVETSKYIIHRMLLPMMDVRKWADYGWIRNFDKIQRNREIASWGDDFMNRRFTTHGLSNPHASDHSIYDMVEIWECYHKDPSTGLSMKTIIANRNVVLMHKPLGEIFWHQRFPFYSLVDCPMTKEMVGIGEIDPVKALVREQNSLRNQRMDSLNATLKPFFMKLRTANIDNDKLQYLKPGDIIETSDMAGLEIVRPPSIHDMTFASEQKTDTDLQLTSGVNDTVIGMSTRSQMRNATTASLLAEATDTRFALTTLLFLEEFRKIGRDQLAMNNQFMSVPALVRVVGQDGLLQDILARPEDVPINPDVYVSLGAELQGDMEIKRQQKLQLFQYLANLPGANVTLYMQELMELFGDQNPQRFFPQGEYIVPTQQIMQQLGLGDPMSTYKEQMGGFGGGVPAENKGDLEEMVNNGSLNGGP